MPDHRILEWSFSKATDILELWSTTETGETRRIRVPGSMVRSLTGGVGFADLPAHSRDYFLKELYNRPKAYGGKIVSD